MVRSAGFLSYEVSLSFPGRLSSTGVARVEGKEASLGGTKKFLPGVSLDDSGQRSL